MKPSPFIFELGQEVEDIVTGFTGIVRSRSQWLTGCNTYGVVSRKLKDDKPQEPVWFDEHILKASGGETVQPVYPADPVKAAEQRTSGGPTTPVPGTRKEQQK